MKNEQLYAIVPMVLVAIGWFVVYVTTVRRDRLAKRRDLRTQYLLEAYRRLESVANRSKAGPDWAEKIESAMADIQLLGSPAQVAMAKTLARDFADRKETSLDDLLQSLRADLRKELNLGPVTERITFLRIVGGNKRE